MEKKLSLSQQIAEIGAGLKFEDLPERVVNNSKMFIMDLLGNIIGLPPCGLQPHLPEGCP